MVDAIPMLHNAPAGSAGPAGRTWDAVCVGSGTGSLAAAAALAKLGRSVLVLEAHTQVGGLTHTFQRKGVRWGTGFHYTGWPTAYENDFPPLWHILTGGRAGWARLPDDADTYLRPDGAFVKSGTRERYRTDLYGAFPAERPAIDRYLADMRRLTAEYRRFMVLQSLPAAVEKLGPGWWLGRRFLRADRTPLVRYMDGIGASERLRDHLWFTWGNFGGIPAETSVGAYAIPTEYMMDGLWCPAAGSRAVAAAFADTIRAAGGEVIRGANVTGLVFRHGRVAGVRVGDTEFRGRHVISGIGARETYRWLVPEDRRPRHADRVMGMRPSCSIFTLYLALDRQFLARHRLTGVNYWAEAVPGSLRRPWDDLDGTPPWLLLSLAAGFQAEGSADPEVVPAEIFTGIRGERFARWQGTRVMKRGPEYADFKADLTDRVLDRAESFWPGFRSAVRYAEAASPLTIASFTRHQDGAAYGIAPDPGRYSERALRACAGVPGLLMAGQDVSAAGVIGAFYGGLTAASAILWRDAGQVLLKRSR